jgi:hypothetical protein
LRVNPNLGSRCCGGNSAVEIDVLSAGMMNGLRSVYSIWDSKTHPTTQCGLKDIPCICHKNHIHIR